MKKIALLLIAVILLACAFKLRQMLLIECGLALVSTIVAFVFPNIGARWFAGIEHGIARIARKRLVAAILVGSSALALRAALLPALPIPVPGVHDEFGYLLMADTFAHGRLSNPTHPMWEHFETFSVIQKPTYQCFAPPAQGFALATGQLLFRHPYWGVWLSAGFMAAALCWMLQGWFPPYWALLGALLAVVRLASFSYWTNSYFGGMVAALGGALVLGAFPRIKRYLHVRDAVIMGLGLAFLATSRPYEGGLFCLPIAAAMMVWLFIRNSHSIRQTLLKLVLPITVCLTLTFTVIGYYFYCVTGSPWRNPYMVHQAAYMPMSYFPWVHLKPVPEYRHEILRRFYQGYAMDLYFLNRRHPVLAAGIKLTMIWFFYFGPLLTLPFLILGLVLPRHFSIRDIGRNTRFFFLIAAITSLGMLLPIFFSAHYSAPLTSVFYALVIASLQRIRHWKFKGRPTGLTLVRAVPGVAVVLLVLAVLAAPLHISNNSTPWTWCSPWPGVTERARIQSQIEHTPGRHLLIVHYEPNHDYMASWVSNGADIDNSKFVWANDMGREKNQELIDYFKDRQVWLVEPDQSPARVSLYR